MRTNRTIVPRSFANFESALDYAKMCSHHNYLQTESQFMYVIQRDGAFWVDSSRAVGVNERLISSVLYRFIKPVIHKIIVHNMAAGYFVKHPDNGAIYAVFQSRKPIANTEYIIIHFEPDRFWPLKHGNPNTEWKHWEHLNNFVRGIISRYNRNIGLYEKTNS